MEQYIENLLKQGTELGIKIIIAILVLIVGINLAKFLIKKIVKGKAFSQIDASVRSFIVSLLKIVGYTLLIISAAMIVGIPVTSFITILASAGVAVGLALQGALSNFAGGIMILIFKPFKVGDFIETSAHSGTVRAITVIYTILITPDNKCITLPNGTLTNAPIVDATAEPTRRVDISFNIDPSEDIEKVISSLNSCVANVKEVMAAPAPTVGLSAFDENAAVYTVNAWCKTGNTGTVRAKLYKLALETFRKNDISMATAKLDVHLEK